MATALEDITRYLVAKQLANQGYVVRILYEYFADDVSPSDLSRKYNVTKAAIRGYIQRMVEKCGSVAKARALVKRVAPIVMKIEPIIVFDENKMAMCRVCGDKFLKYESFHHVLAYHTMLVTKHVYEVIDELRRLLRAG